MEAEAGAQVQPLRLPRAEDLMQREREALSRALRAATESWPPAAALGLALERTLSARTPEELPAMPGAVTYRLADAPVLMAVQAELAAALVCLSLGGPPPAEVDADLTPVDLAVLDASVGPALAAVAASLGLPEGEGVERLALGAREAALELGGPVAGGLLRAPRVAGRALVVVAQEAVRQALARPGPTLADDPRALLGARVEVEARIAGARVPLAEMLAVEVGDVVLLDGPISRQVGVYVGGRQVARGRPGAKGGRMAVRITDVQDLRAGGISHGE